MHTRQGVVTYNKAGKLAPYIFMNIQQAGYFIKTPYDIVFQSKLLQIRPYKVLLGSPLSAADFNISY